MSNYHLIVWELIFTLHFFCYIHTSSSLGVESVCTIIFAKKPKKESVTINYQLFLFTSFDTPHSKIVEMFCTNLKTTLKS